MNLQKNMFPIHARQAPPPFVKACLLALLVSCLSLSGPLAAQPVPSAPAAPDPEIEVAVDDAEGNGTPFSCVYCDLRGADLAGRDMRNSNFTGANLRGANLSGAQMQGVILVAADLTDANLTNAVLKPSVKGPANLSRANLTGANLQGADLEGADLQFAQLPGADLTAVDLTRTVVGPRLFAGRSSDGRLTSLRHSRLPAGLDVDPEQADVEGAQWVGARVGAEADTELACGRADLSLLTSRIYVDPFGTDDDSCGATPDTACRTIPYGIAHCAAAGCGVLVSWSEYSNSRTVNLRSGVHVYGGCLPKSQANPRYYSVILAPAGGEPAITAAVINENTLLQGFQLAASDGGGRSSRPSIAARVEHSQALSLLDVQLVAGRGGEGTPGEDGIAGTAGGDGSGREPGSVGACANTTGGAGAVKRNVKVDTGFSKFTCKGSCSENFCFGYSSSPGNTSIARGGVYGADNCTNCPQSRGKTGDAGSPGDSARCGNRGTASTDASGSFTGGVWKPALAGGGTHGGNASGGGGGGAGGYKAGSCVWVKTQDKGNSGGGGGAGGCAGTGGKGGQQGGGSFALVAVASKVTLTRCMFIGGDGGLGGRGGTGAPGGKGGSGAAGARKEGGGYGGNGGNGGAGGAGGGGASGNGGPAVNVALVAGSTLVKTEVQHSLGRSGNPGSAGSGGSAIVAGVCAAPGGETGRNGDLADEKTYN